MPIIDPDAPTGIVHLSCNKTHILHEACYDHLNMFAKEKRQELLCPMCRAVIDVDKVVRVKKMNQAEIEGFLKIEKHLKG
jgi:hypothetical protein